ncbi:hypothetical protein JTB14_011488 [Gonioctena quinquepunctata]|nr:hypothetical protein JTB14_011488 [Gonioctena quinquepunctata]
MSVEKFQVNHLLDFELEYELSIRGITTARTVADKRKILTRLLSKEQVNPDVNLKLDVYEFDFKTEQEDINKSLTSITEMIIDFSDSGQTYATCLKLESDLYDSVQLTTSVVTNVSVQPPPVINIPAPVVNCSNNFIPISKWGVELNGDPKTVHSFLEHVTELAQSRKVTDQTLYESAIEFFVGDAFVWYRSVKSEISDWKSLVTSLKRDFLSSIIDEDIWGEIKQRRQKRNESVAIFIAHVETLFGRLSRQPVESSKVKQLRKNILPEYLSQLALHEISTVADLSKLCRRLEEANHLKGKNNLITQVAHLSVGTQERKFNNHSENFKKNKLRKQYNHTVRNHNGRKPDVDNRGHISENEVTIASNSQSVSCWNCGLPNHVFSDCRTKRKIFCYKCGLAGVKLLDCTRCSKNE